jgi:nicotinamide-nucleotide amidase
VIRIVTDQNMEGRERVQAEETTRLAERVAGLAARGVQIGVAESLTSGALASALGAAPDASTWFTGAVVAYSKQVKFDVLGVTPGPVITERCAREMAAGAARLLGAHLVAAVTGAGGPGPEEGQPPGTVFLAHGTADAIVVERLSLRGDPAEIVEQTVRAALTALIRDLSGPEQTRADG